MPALIVEVIRYDDASEEFQALVTQLSLHSCAQWGAVTDRQVTPIHPIRQDRLRVQRVQHVYAISITIIGMELYESRCCTRPNSLQNTAQRH